MNTDRIKYLFNEKCFGLTRDLHRAVLVAVCEEAKSIARRYDVLLTDRIVTVRLKAVVERLPQYDIEDVLEAIKKLHNSGYLNAECHREIQLETHLFKMIKEGWIQAMGVRRFTPFFHDRAIHTTTSERAVEIEAIRIGRERKIGKEVVTA